MLKAKTVKECEKHLLKLESKWGGLDFPIMLRIVGAVLWVGGLNDKERVVEARNYMEAFDRVRGKGAAENPGPPAA